MNDKVDSTQWTGDFPVRSAPPADMPPVRKLMLRALLYFLTLGAVLTVAGVVVRGLL